MHYMLPNYLLLQMMYLKTKSNLAQIPLSKQYFVREKLNKQITKKNSNVKKEKQKRIKRLQMIIKLNVSSHSSRLNLNHLKEILKSKAKIILRLSLSHLKFMHHKIIAFLITYLLPNLLLQVKSQRLRTFKFLKKQIYQPRNSKESAYQRNLAFAKVRAPSSLDA